MQPQTLSQSCAWLVLEGSRGRETGLLSAASLLKDSGIIIIITGSGQVA